MSAQEQPCSGSSTVQSSASFTQQLYGALHLKVVTAMIVADAGILSTQELMAEYIFAIYFTNQV